MIKALYSLHNPEESQEQYQIRLLSEVASLTLTISDHIVEIAGYYQNALQYMEDSGLAHRLPELDSNTTVEILSDLADLRQEIGIEIDAIRRRAKHTPGVA